MGIFPVSRVSVSPSRALLILAVSATVIVLLLASKAATAAENDITLQGPDVVIIAGEDKVIYEFRQNGQLRMVRVVPTWGKPYYLVPRDNTTGFGDLERADMLLPQWVIAEF